MRSFQTELRLIVNAAISQTEGSFAKAALDAIPPLTLKTEDGRFVKVEFAGLASEHGFIHPGVIAQDPDAYKDFETVGWWKVYRIVPEPEP